MVATEYQKYLRSSKLQDSQYQKIQVAGQPTPLFFERIRYVNFMFSACKMRIFKNVDIEEFSASCKVRFS